MRNDGLGKMQAWLKRTAQPVFFCGVDEGRGRYMLHVNADADVAVLREEAATVLGSAPDKIVICRYDERRLVRAKSLADLVAPFARETIAYDPTATIGRARVVLDAMAMAKREMAKLVRGSYLDPIGRVIYVVVDAATDRATAERVARTVLEAIDRATEITGSEFNRPPLTVRVVDALPQQTLVAVDRVSYRRRPLTGRARPHRVRVAMASLAAVFGLGTSIAVAQQPAVSGLNAKIDASGGWVKLDAEEGVAGFVTGAVTAPLGRQFGVQFDGGAGAIDGDFYWGAGAHLFWRDPSKGLLGLTGQIAEFKNATMVRAGAEGEFYLDKFSLGAYGGYQFGDKGRRVKVEDGFFGGVSLKFYLTDNFVLRGRAGVEAGHFEGRGGFELQPGFAALPGLSIFADAGGGTDNHAFALAGVRYYFGQNKSLKRRHREDDPDSVITTEYQGFVGRNVIHSNVSSN